MSLTVLRVDNPDRIDVRCSCGGVHTVNAKRLASGRCRQCARLDARYAEWQAELVAPFDPARALKVGPRVSA